MKPGDIVMYKTEDGEMQGVILSVGKTTAVVSNYLSDIDEVYIKDIKRATVKEMVEELRYYHGYVS